MTAPLVKSTARATTTIRTDLDARLPDDLERRLRLGVRRMSRQMKSVPLRFRGWRYDATRSARKQKPAGKLPEFALACLRSGAPLADVLAPLNELVGWVRSHAPRLRLAEAIEAQGKEQGDATVAALRLIKDCENPSLDALDAFIKEAEELMVSTQQALDTAYALRYQEKTRGKP